VAAKSQATKQRWAEYRALKAEVLSNGNELPAELQRYGRPRGHTRSMKLARTPE
jgi:hypothetical protein